MIDPKLKIQQGTELAREGVFAEIEENGPIRLHGGTQLTQQFMVPDENDLRTSSYYKEGISFQVKNVVTLCRCGLSSNKPFCDNSHKNIERNNIDLTETAVMDPEFNDASLIEGPQISMSDGRRFCASGRFCNAGASAWDEVQKGNESSNSLVVHIAHHCPGGRLIAWDNATRQPIESFENPSVNLIEDLKNGISGPLMLRGGIPVKSSSGEFYEVRNRQALCRCGHSQNKPFCDGAHSRIKFSDGLASTPLRDGKEW